MQDHLPLLDHTHFRHLSDEEIENPFIYINEFCERETKFHYFRRDILDLLKTAYSYEEKFYSNHSPSYGYDQQQLIRIMEAVYVLYLRRYNFTSGRSRVPMEYHGCLNNQEVADVGHFLEEFFGYKDLDGWREYLDEILIHAYKEGGVGFFEYDKTPFKTIGLLEKFVEAVFLIHELNARERAEETPELSEVSGTPEIPESSGMPVPRDFLPQQLLKEVHDFFSAIDPGFIGEGLRYILLNYLRNGFETGFGKKDMLAELMHPLQRLFQLLDVARREIGHSDDRQPVCKGETMT